MPNNYVVYMHTSPSGKRYVGITSQRPERRWRADGSGYSDSPVFYCAIKKYGFKNFDHRILFDHLDFETAERFEQLIIFMFRTTDRRFGYNMENGGTSGKALSEETREKLSIANRGKGNLWSLNQWRENGGEPWLKGKRGVNMDAVHEGYARWRENGGEPWNKGTKGLNHHTEEFKRNMSERVSGGKHPLARSIAQYSLNGEYIRTFETITEVAKYLGKEKPGDVSNVTACAHGRRSKAYGYIWRYADREVS